MIALYTADFGLIPSPAYGPLITTRRDPEHSARNKPFGALKLNKIYTNKNQMAHEQSTTYRNNRFYLFIIFVFWAKLQHMYLFHSLSAFPSIIVPVINAVVRNG